jgi:hypothetical protein
LAKSILKLFSRKSKPEPWRVSAEALADLKALANHPGYKVWLALLERAAASDVAMLGRSDTVAQDAYGASQRLSVWQRCYTLIDTIIAGQEAVNEFSRTTRNGGTPDRGKHWGSAHFFS